MITQANITQEPKKKREWQPKEYINQGETKNIGAKSNANLYNRIIDVINKRRVSKSNVIRQLLYMGLKEWELNQLAGRTKKKDIEADYNKRLAEAQAIAAQKERKKNSKKSDTITAVTPMLFQPDDEE